jgi:hypothetical protein
VNNGNDQRRDAQPFVQAIRFIQAAEQVFAIAGRIASIMPMLITPMPIMPV